MPQVEVCMYCKKVMDPEKEKFVLLAATQGPAPRQIAHVECYQQPRTSRVTRG